MHNMFKQQINTPASPPLLSWQGLQILPGLNAVTGDEGSGKTTLLRQIAESLGSQALYLDLRLPEHDADTPRAILERMQRQHPTWNVGLEAELTEALLLSAHMDKQLFMLSAGSRRKVSLVGLLSCGTKVTCLDQPYAALDQGSVTVLREFLSDMSDHTMRAWLVADYEADAQLQWQNIISMTR